MIASFGGASCKPGTDVTPPPGPHATTTGDAPSPHAASPPVAAEPDAGDADAGDAATHAATPLTPPIPLPFASYESVCAEVPDGGAPFDLLMGSKPPAKRVTVAFTSKSVRPSASDTPGLGFTAYVTASEVGLRREVFHLPFGGDPYQCCTKGGPSALTFSCMLSGVDQIESRGKVSRQGNAIVLEWCTANLSTRRVSSRGGVSVPVDPSAVITFTSRKPECAPPLPH